MRGFRSSGTDMISNLPCYIIENILKCLPMRDVVRTSILSREWRYKWVTLPELIFDSQFGQELPGNKKLKAVIYQILLLHKGPIHKFTLRVPEFRSCPDINHWILFLSKNNIQEFSLRIYRGEYHKLPSHLFTFLQLTHLDLFNCVFDPPPTFKGFSRLVELDFHKVVVAPERFGSFISDCPLLERLRLIGCRSFDCLEIDAPNLKLFSFRGICKFISFKHTPLLADISMAFFPFDLNVEPHVKGKNSNLIEFFCCLPAIERLNLDRFLLEFLAVGGVPKRLPSALNHLKFLDISEMCFENVDEVSCALCLIRSSPNLQKLKITAFINYGAMMEPVVEFWQAQEFSDYSLSRLQKVKMRLFSGAVPEMEFVKFLLANSTVLERMEISPLPERVSDGGSRMLKKLTRFRRASPKAEIIYEDPD